MKKSRGILSLILVAALSVLLGVTTIRGLDSEGMAQRKILIWDWILRVESALHIR